MINIEDSENEIDLYMNNIENDKNPKKIEKNTSLSISYITDDNINRCWSFLRDIILCQSISQNVAIDYKMDKGKNTFIEGNEFSCYFVGISNIHYKCCESKNSFFSRKISWILALDIGFSLRKTYFIYPITSNNKTLVKLRLDLICTENNEPMNFQETRDYYYKLQASILNNVRKLMDESNKFLYIHESFIAKNNFNTCWKSMINLNLLSDFTSGKIGEKFESNGDPEKKGTFYKCKLKDNKQTIFLKIKNIKKSKKRNRWIYNLETVGINIHAIRHEIEISVTKINEESCQISILVNFNEKINKQLYEYKKEELNKIMKILKESINKLKLNL
jgi:hypothetical protein